MRRELNDLKTAVEGTNKALESSTRSLTKSIEHTTKTLTQSIENTNRTLENTTKTLTQSIEATNRTLENTTKTLTKSIDDTNAMLRRVIVSVSNLTGTVAEMKDDMKGVATKKDISQLNGRMDGFSGLLLDSRHRWAIHADTLAEHDKRLNTLETKTS